MINMPVSALIITLNEELNIARCISSLNWCADIVVLDAHSTDKTAEIAESFGARVFLRPFDDYASQRNFGLNKIEYKNPWVLMVDADEVVPQKLVEELEIELANTSNNICLYRLRRKDFFFGRWIKRSSGYPTWFGRLVRVGRVRVERAINEEYITDGDILLLQSHLYHYPFNKGISAWIEKHNRYSTLEAELLSRRSQSDIRWSDLFSTDPANRRRTLKMLIYKLPGRPMIIFLALYIFRGGFLDGRAGLIFCILRSYYEFMINCKMLEIIHLKTDQTN